MVTAPSTSCEAIALVTQVAARPHQAGVIAASGIPKIVAHE
jgi:hypothetical protein